MKTKESKISYRSSDLSQILQETFGKSINLARIKLMALLISALCKVQTVCFERLATGFDHSATKASSLRRIQRFMADYVLDANLIAKLVFSLLPTELFSLVIIAFTWAYLVGIFLHENVKLIRVLNNGRKAKSFFKYGLNYIEEVLLNTHFQTDINIFKFLSCT